MNTDFDLMTDLNGLQEFIEVKELSVSAYILWQSDMSKQFIIQCEASAVRLGGILKQVIEGDEEVIAYGSRLLSRKKFFVH